MKRGALFTTALALVLGACSHESDLDHSHGEHTHSHTSSGPVDMGSQFNAKAMTTDPIVVECQLEDGTASQCLQLVTKHVADNLTIGPFCPATLDDVGGVWNWTGENDGLYRVDRNFLKTLDGFGYRFYDAEGKVYQSDISKAPPTEDHSCIHVALDPDAVITSLIPMHPKLSNSVKRLGTVNKVGMALTGTPIFSDAPTIAQTGHMPALDTCGGHVDPGGWYHWHANSSDVNTAFETEKVQATCGLNQISAALFGYAFDGFPIYGSQDVDGSEAKNLDECGGHTSETPLGTSTYHYHTPETFPNLPQCLSGVQAVGNFSTTAKAGVGATNRDGSRAEPPGGGHRKNGPPPEFGAAAKALGISEADLFKAFQDEGGREADVGAVARRLGISESALREALPRRPRSALYDYKFHPIKFKCES